MARFMKKLADAPKYPRTESTLLMKDLMDLLIGFQAEYSGNLKSDEHAFVDKLIDMVEKRLGGSEVEDRTGRGLI